MLCDVAVNPFPARRSLWGCDECIPSIEFVVHSDGPLILLDLDGMTSSLATFLNKQTNQIIPPLPDRSIHSPHLSSRKAFRDVLVSCVFASIPDEENGIQKTVLTISFLLLLVLSAAEPTKAWNVWMTEPSSQTANSAVWRKNLNRKSLATSCEDGIWSVPVGWAEAPLSDIFFCTSSQKGWQLHLRPMAHHSSLLTLLTSVCGL